MEVNGYKIEPEANLANAILKMTTMPDGSIHDSRGCASSRFGLLDVFVNLDVNIYC
jgi:hypothetical protein